MTTRATKFQRVKYLLAVICHFEKQGWRKAFDGVSCQYRTGDGLACAIGGTLSDAVVNKPYVYSGDPTTAQLAYGQMTTLVEANPTARRLPDFAYAHLAKKFGPLTKSDWGWLADVQGTHDSLGVVTPSDLRTAFVTLLTQTIAEEAIR